MNETFQMFVIIIFKQLIISSDLYSVREFIFPNFKTSFLTIPLTVSDFKKSFFTKTAITAVVFIAYFIINLIFNMTYVFYY